MQFTARVWLPLIPPICSQLGRFFLNRRLVVGFWIMAGAAYAAFAQTDNVAAGPKWFNIPSQSLASALQAYGEIAGVQVLYESALAKDRRSSEVKGNLLPKDALRLLLSQTDLTVSYIRPDAITIAHAMKPDEMAAADRALVSEDLSLDTLQIHAAEDTDNEARLRLYSEALRSDIQNVLGKTARTRSGTYRVGLKLWVDTARRIQKTEVFQSTGDKDRDEAITATLNGIVISQAAPANTPQPVRISIVVRAIVQ